MFRATTATIASVIVIALGLAASSNLHAETPPGAVNDAGVIPLTPELLGKMEKFLKNAFADAGARAEVAAVGKDPSVTYEKWGSAISAKCPKAVAIFKDVGLTPDEFGKGIIALRAVGLPEDEEGLKKSTDKTIQANIAFFAKNKARADAIFRDLLKIEDS